MIIVVKNANFSDNNLGTIKIPGELYNFNIGEGTTSPKLFTYQQNPIGEFMGVQYEKINNPSPFEYTRKLTLVNNSKYLYEYLTPDRQSIGINPKPTSLSMAIWINYSEFELTDINRLVIGLQIFNSGWKLCKSFIITNATFETYNVEYSWNNSSYINGKVAAKNLATKTINGDIWYCIGVVFSDLTYIDGSYEEGCPPRIFINNETSLTSELTYHIANMQIVETDKFLDPEKDYN